jgi:hypothetical protein
MYKNSPHEIALISNNSFLVGSVVIAAANHVVFPASTPAIVIAELQAEQDSGLPTTANISCSSNALLPLPPPIILQHPLHAPRFKVVSNAPHLSFYTIGARNIPHVIRLRPRSPALCDNIPEAR